MRRACLVLAARTGWGLTELLALDCAELVEWVKALRELDA